MPNRFISLANKDGVIIHLNITQIVYFHYLHSDGDCIRVILCNGEEMIFPITCEDFQAEIANLVYTN